MKRDYYFDNLKAVLIFLVILGHFLLPIETGPLCILKRWIYSFHMPLFIFVSGYFSKGVYKRGHFRWDKIRFFIGLYILFVTGIQLNYMFLDGNAFD
ncbi:MAG: acyltransferase family protein, partial [Erysipelotrichaceae bacterium]|nr:acyltransferase family protein [Erysipelotrichaceae bacterium]